MLIYRKYKCQMSAPQPPPPPPPNFMMAPEIRRKKYGASHQSPNFIQTSAKEFVSAEPMTPMELYAHVGLHLFITL